MGKLVRRVLIALGLAVAAVLVLAALRVRRMMQHPDRAFDTRVERPTYSGGRRPRVIIDEAHKNVHRAGGLYAPFASLMSNDGYEVVASSAPFTADVLRGARVLVIANAMGARLPQLPSAGKPAFTNAEADAVRDWVRAGGSLLLVADHAPVGAANQILARRLGVRMSEGTTWDTVAYERGASDSWLVFSRENGLLGDHPITRGRDSTERVDRIVSFTGQSLEGPPGSIPLLRLSPTAMDQTRGRAVSVAGRAQGVALELGAGRVVVLGEAAMLTAQTTDNGRLRFGMSWPNVDNKQFALNVVRWLARDLE